jgi:flagellar hook-associated protein 2
MSTTISPVFTGVSKYATDLQSVIDRAVGIASLPLKQLQNQLTDLNSRSTALSDLTAKFEALQTAMQAVSDASGPGGLSGSSSAPSTVSASVSGAVAPDTYSVDVLDTGAYSSSVSSATLPAITDPSSASFSSSSEFTLTVNGKTWTLSPAANSLTSLMQSINSSGAGVQASLINTGGSDGPSYRLTIRSRSLAADTIQLNDGSTDLLTTLSTGKPGQYSLNGLPPITTNSRTVTLAPGVKADLLQKTATNEPVTISVNRDSSSLNSAVSKLVDAYNAAVDAVDGQIGEHSGPLAGQSIVHTLREALSKITQFTQEGGVSSLTQMGLELDKTGKLSFNGFGTADPSDIQRFLGGADTDGFLHAMSGILNSLEAPLDGALPRASKLISDEVTRQNDLIAENQRRVDELQTNLQQQMSAADALLADLENKKTYFNNLFTTMLNQKVSS